VELENKLTEHKKENGKDILVGFSGGRDSSYMLHLLKNKYEMKPIAVTYDWGMVTDLARRNQARMCGHLGVEHIIVAADIPQKRKNINLYLNAWLKNPHLGMVPLLMAGDKNIFRPLQKLPKKIIYL
jgi:glucosamine--fructose-6-phosphate aminotransferase (isomerizing)